jgi:hypothetical protein
MVVLSAMGSIVGQAPASPLRNDDLTTAERGDVWQQLERVLPSTLEPLREAFRRRVISGKGSPLRNFVVRKLLAETCDPTPLAKEFEVGLGLLRNRDAFLAGVAACSGEQFDLRNGRAASADDLADELGLDAGHVLAPLELLWRRARTSSGSQRRGRRR